ncbi:DUF397 domain-containing protein [Streptomyces sp. NPDC050508]|uniref:DUF397 domain-containing protein n=1 Tax=Streptomyces sp. NPDC050508 TaxID=3155405 RepID=UPI00343CF44B
MPFRRLRGGCELPLHPIHIRDSKNQQGPRLTLSPTARAELIRKVSRPGSCPPRERSTAPACRGFRCPASR